MREQKLATYSELVSFYCLITPRNGKGSIFLGSLEKKSGDSSIRTREDSRDSYDRSIKCSLQETRRWEISVIKTARNSIKRFLRVCIHISYNKDAQRDPDRPELQDSFSQFQVFFSLRERIEGVHPCVVIASFALTETRRKQKHYENELEKKRRPRRGRERVWEFIERDPLELCSRTSKSTLVYSLI